VAEHRHRLGSREAVIASIYIGFAVADGRPKVIAVESGLARGFVVLAADAVTGSPWLLVAAPTGHGLKRPLAAPQPLRRQHSLVAAVLHDHRLGRRDDIAVEIAAGLHFR
jgi:hypothetical protein